MCLVGSQKGVCVCVCVCVRACHVGSRFSNEKTLWAAGGHVCNLSLALWEMSPQRKTSRKIKRSQVETQWPWPWRRCCAFQYVFPVPLPLGTNILLPTSYSRRIMLGNSGVLCVQTKSSKGSNTELLDNHWEIKGRFRKRVVLANVPSFRFSVPGEHPPKPPFWKPSFCQHQKGSLGDKRAVS